VYVVLAESLALVLDELIWGWRQHRPVMLSLPGSSHVARRSSAHDPAVPFRTLRPTGFLCGKREWANECGCCGFYSLVTFRCVYICGDGDFDA